MANTLNADVRRVVVEFLTLADMHPVRLAARGWHEAVAEFATFQHRPAALVASSRTLLIDLPRWVTSMHAWGTSPDLAAWVSRRAVTKYAAYVTESARIVDVISRRCIVFVDCTRALRFGDNDDDCGETETCCGSSGLTATLRCTLGVDLNAPIAASWLRRDVPPLRSLVVQCASQHFRRPLASSAVRAASVPHLTSLTLEDAADLPACTSEATCAELFPQLTQLRIVGLPTLGAAVTIPPMPHLRSLDLGDRFTLADKGGDWPFAAFLRACAGLSELHLAGSFASLVLHGDDDVSPDAVASVAELAKLTTLCVRDAFVSRDGREAARLLARLERSPASRHLERVHIVGLASSDMGAVVATGAFPMLRSVNGEAV